MEGRDKSREGEKGGKGVLRIFSVVVAMVLLYVGSFGPVFALALKRPVPEWILTSYTPLELLWSRSPAIGWFFNWYVHVWTGDPMSEVL